MDKGGHPLSVWADTVVEERPIGPDMILDRMKEMDTKIKELDAKDKELESKINAIDAKGKELDVKENEMDAKIKTIEAREQEMNSKVNNFRTRLENSKDAIISATTSYRGHNYLLSKPILVNVHEANRLCRLYGGYLAEINDKQEFQLLADFSNSHESVTIDVMLGATDEGHEGRWTFLTSRGNMTSFVWEVSQPTGGTDQNCLYLSTTAKKMFDDACLKYSSSWPKRFLCEVNA
ncbi:C-type lectin domain family 3 member A-like [Aplysia californica]|uniref:C-type lectin domain family 3 member A-like n=1 Tax=Aplysia californica TaxID=6500 RepID=A0ABM1VQ30_APLCA|nr:C-type lectin domain family 3 member A-like [Aplysia californica]